MHKETVRKASEARPGKTLPTEGGRSARQTNAEIGAITKDSSGRPKAAPRGANAGTTRANQTTSTSFPQKPGPKSFRNRLGEMHTAEKELTLALPLVAKAAKSKDRETLLNIHLKETKGRVMTLWQPAKIR